MDFNTNTLIAMIKKVILRIVSFSDDTFVHIPPSTNLDILLLNKGKCGISTGFLIAFTQKYINHLKPNHLKNQFTNF